MGVHSPVTKLNHVFAGNDGTIFVQHFPKRLVVDTGLTLC